MPDGKLMDLKTLLYVSKSVIPPADAGREIDRIVSEARATNPVHEVTGVLILTEGRFAQVFEDPSVNLWPASYAIGAMRK
jgi:hypothetical protein